MEPNQGNLEPKPKSYSEIADIVFPNPIGLPCPDYATLLFSRILYHFSNLNTHTQNTRNYNKIKFNNHPLYSNLLCLNLIKEYIPPRSLLFFSSQKTQLLLLSMQIPLFSKWPCSLFTPTWSLSINTSFLHSFRIRVQLQLSFFPPFLLIPQSFILLHHKN